MKQKTTQQIYDQHQRIFRAAMRRGQRLARAADPETDGHELLVHNWGNEKAKQAWASTWARYRKADVWNKMYITADHHENHGPHFKPLWCSRCSAKEQGVLAIASLISRPL